MEGVPAEFLGSPLVVAHLKGLWESAPPVIQKLRQGGAECGAKRNCNLNRLAATSERSLKRLMRLQFALAAPHAPLSLRIPNHRKLCWDATIQPNLWEGCILNSFLIGDARRDTYAVHRVFSFLSFFPFFPFAFPFPHHLPPPIGEGKGEKERLRKGKKEKETL